MDCLASTTLPATDEQGRIAEAAPFDPWAFDLASGNGTTEDVEPPGPTLMKPDGARGRGDGEGG